MKRVLEGLEPNKVFYYFEELSRIPHPSYQEKKISDYLVSFAKERNLEHYQDSLYNVIIIKEASPGYEEAEPVILQGHMDMVCEQESDCKKDMTKEGLDLAVEGDDVFAKGTTLGGDDGIALAMGLAILDSEDIPHPRLEVVFTVSEEVGMEGASGIDLSMLRGRKLLNIDSEEEGVFLAGCAGGALVTLTLSVGEQEYKDEGFVRVSIEGLQGGHSGTEIHKGRGNANILLGRLLYEVYDEVAFSLVTVSGGSKDNAITREADALLACERPEALLQILDRAAGRLIREYQETEPNMVIHMTEDKEGGKPSPVMTAESTKAYLSLLHTLPHGVVAMCQGMEDLVETSLNLGIVTTEGHTIKLCYCVRSSVDQAFDDLVGEMEQIAQKHGADYGIKGRYPAWEFAEVSPLRQEMIEIYREMFGKEPMVNVMHAGVECGQLAQKLPGLDSISFGPNLYDIHTPKERMSISSVRRTYEFLLELLRRAQ